MLISAAGDRYVSPHSARVENARQAFADKVNGQSNIELVERLQRNLEHSDSTVERYHVIHQGLPQGNQIFDLSKKNNLTKFSRKVQNFQKISKFSKNFKIFKKFSKNFKIFKKV